MAANYHAADFLIRLKNAKLAGRKTVNISASKFVVAIAKVLQKQGILNKIENKDGALTVTLAYQKKEPVLLDVKIVSRPGLRVYKTLDQLRKKRGASIYILSTPNGVVNDKDAIASGSGGELIAEIY